MTPITNQSQLHCINCVWGTQDLIRMGDDSIVFCEIWSHYESVKNYCFSGDFPCSVSNRGLQVLSFEQAHERLPVK